MSPLNRKIEDRALSAIQNIINCHPTMEGYFNKRDKELSWDGYIRIYKNDDKESDKSNFDYDIDVQVKGHIDKDLKILHKDRIKESVELDDLKNYYRKNGCLYFVVYMTEDGSKTSIYYSSLYPSKIKIYLGEAERKGNKKTISIPLIKLNENSAELLNLCKQFGFEVRKQGSGLGQIVPKMIVSDNYEKVKAITATVVGGASSDDLLKRISTGDIVLYGSIDDTGMQYPVQTDQMVAVFDERIIGSVFVDGIEYYDSYIVKRSVFGPDVKGIPDLSQKVIVLSQNIAMLFKESTVEFSFRLNTDLFQLMRDAEFFLAFIESGEMALSDKKVYISDSDVENEFIEQLNGIVFAGSVLEESGCNISVPFNELSFSDKEQIDFLCRIKSGLVEFNTDQNIFPFIWTFRDKKWPIIIDKTQEEIKIIGFLFDYSSFMVIGGPDNTSSVILPEESENVVPNFFNVSPDILANLYYYDYESMYKQVEMVKINEVTADALNILALNLISAYDISNNERLLDLANDILYRIIDVFPGIVYYQINLAQTEVRKGEKMSRERIEKLERFDLSFMRSDYDDLKGMVDYCISVVKGNRFEADKLYEELSDNDRKGVDGWPIRTLHLQLK